MRCEKTNVHLKMFWNALSQTSYVKIISLMLERRKKHSVVTHDKLV